MVTKLNYRVKLLDTALNIALHAHRTFSLVLFVAGLKSGVSRSVFVLKTIRFQLYRIFLIVLRKQIILWEWVITGDESWVCGYD